MASATHLTPEQRRIRARIGAFALHATGGTNTGPATAANLARFDREVLAAAEARGEALTPEEFARRVRSARKAYFARLALASSIARARDRKKAGPVIETPGPAEGGRQRHGEHPEAA